MGKSLQTMRILWAALSSSPLLFCVVMLVVSPQSCSDSPQQPDYTLSVVTLAALAMAVMSFLVPRAVFLLTAKGTTLAITNEPDANANTAFRDIVPTRRVFADRANALTVAGQIHSTRLIVSLAMSETIAIMGMVLGMQFRYGPEVTVPFCVLALALMLVRFPREAAIIKQFEAAYGATLPPA